MESSRIAALQLCPFSSYLEAGLAARFDVIRWFGLSDAQRNEWLAGNAPRVRAVVTGGHIGCSTQMMQALPALAIVAVNGVGVDKVDLDYARQHGVRIVTTPGALTDDVADLAVGLVITLLRGIASADQYVRREAWLQGEYPLARKVTGRSFGIVGLGHIGGAIGARLAAFGSVAYTGPTRKPSPYEYHADAVSLARACDVLVIACPANAATRHLVGQQVIEALGADGYLVNVARGAVVDEAALIAALDAGRLAGAALDVYENEPRVPAALRESPKVVLTPHIASATIETRVRMADMLFAGFDAIGATPL